MPNSKRSCVDTPVPMAAVVVACPVAASDWFCARVVTSTWKLPACAVLPADAVATAVSDEVADRVWNFAGVARASTDDWKDDRAERMVP